MQIFGHICKNGQLCGLVTKYGQRLRDTQVGEAQCTATLQNLAYLGFHDPKSGQPEGPIYKGLLGGSIMYSENLDFSGSNVAYIYHKNHFAIMGEFNKSYLLIKGHKVAFKADGCDINGILRLKFFKPENPSVVYHYQPPTLTSFGDQPTVEDELASEWVEVRASKDKVTTHCFMFCLDMIQFRVKDYLPPKTYPKVPKLLNMEDTE